MPIPFILAGAAVALAGTGIKKGYDANQKNKKARRIARQAERDFQEACDKLEIERERLNEKIEELGKLKLSVFSNEIKQLVIYLKECKQAISHHDHEKITFTQEEIKQLDNTVSTSLEVTAGIAQGAASGALMAIGSYGSVGMLASATTGTAISTLSGAAATNATLAWLGGGAIAAGGGGIALGTAVLGGMVAGPAIAIAGFVMDSKAEENLTEAYDYRAEVEKNIETIEYTIEEYNAIHGYINELTDIIENLRGRFISTSKKIEGTFFKKALRYLGFKKLCEEEDFEQVLVIGKYLKSALNISLIEDDGNRNLNFEKEVERITIQ